MKRLEGMMTLLGNAQESGNEPLDLTPEQIEQINYILIDTEITSLIQKGKYMKAYTNLTNLPELDTNNEQRKHHRSAIKNSLMDVLNEINKHADPGEIDTDELQQKISALVDWRESEEKKDKSIAQAAEELDQHEEAIYTDPEYPQATEVFTEKFESEKAKLLELTKRLDSMEAANLPISRLQQLEKRKLELEVAQLDPNTNDTEMERLNAQIVDIEAEIAENHAADKFSGQMQEPVVDKTNDVKRAAGIPPYITLDTIETKRKALKGDRSRPAQIQRTVLNLQEQALNGEISPDQAPQIRTRINDLQQQLNELESEQPTQTEQPQSPEETIENLVGAVKDAIAKKREEILSAAKKGQPTIQPGEVNNEANQLDRIGKSLEKLPRDRLTPRQRQMIRDSISVQGEADDSALLRGLLDWIRNL